MPAGPTHFLMGAKPCPKRNRKRLGGMFALGRINYPLLQKS
jgi:hypothetical protein